MSGGHFDHGQYKFIEIADEIQRLIETNESQECDRCGDPIGRQYPPAVIGQFRTAERLCRQAGIYAQRIDWLVSGDDGPENFLQRLGEELAQLDGAEPEDQRG